jgi:hypothetical protein
MLITPNEFEGRGPLVGFLHDGLEQRLPARRARAEIVTGEKSSRAHGSFNVQVNPIQLSQVR